MTIAYIFIGILILVLVGEYIELHRYNFRVKQKEAALYNTAKQILLQSDRKNPLGLYDADVLPGHESIIEAGYTRTPKQGYTVGIEYNFIRDCFIFIISNNDYKTEFVIQRERFISNEFRNDLNGFLLHLEDKFNNVIDDLDVE